MSPTVQYNLIKQQLENVLVYLEPYLNFANCHMVDYFTKNSYPKHLPPGVDQEISKIGYKQTANLILNCDTENKAPILHKFINDCKNFSLCNHKQICLQPEKFIETLDQLGGKNMSRLKLEVHMKEKKSHEVEVLSSLTANLAHVAKSSHVVDIGDGKGYLSSMLAFHYNLPVLGVDASLSNTNSAVKRAEKLGKLWSGVLKSPKKSMLPKNERNMDPNILLYKQVTQYVTEETDFLKLLSDIFTTKPENITLVGLHTCGNLAPTSLKIFNNNKDIKAVCNVSCCYHLMKEPYELDVDRYQALEAKYEFDRDRFEVNKEKYELNKCKLNESKYDENNLEEDVLNLDASENIGFPISDFLTQKNFQLGRAARMLSAQSVDRILHKKELPSKIAYYRAVLQILLQNYCIELTLKNVGRTKQKCDNFVDYVRAALVKLEVDLKISDQEIEDFFQLYKNREDEMYAFTLIRYMLAPVVESVILLDRLLYLHEQGHENSYLVQLFDPVISPRCYGIIALKR